MNNFIKSYNQDMKKMHPIERAARVHCELVKIHPFIDGNGRTARLIMNLELMKSGYPVTWIKEEKRLEYYESLDIAFLENNYEPFLKLLSDMIYESFNFYFNALK